MVNITSNSVIINRGDCFTYTLPVNTGSVLFPQIYNLLEGDKVYFHVSYPRHQYGLGVVIEKEADSSKQDEFGNVSIDFVNSDTATLFPGLYFMTAKLVKSDGWTYTILPKIQFYINE